MSAVGGGWPPRSVRHKLLTIALGPLLVVFPLLLMALVLWADTAYDRLLITKVRADLAVAHGYFDKVLSDVGQGSHAVAQSYGLMQYLLPAQAAFSPSPASLLAQRLAQEQQRLGLDFLRLAAPNGQALDVLGPMSAVLPSRLLAQARWRGTSEGALSQSGHLLVLSGDELAQLAPALRTRLHIPLRPTPNAAPTERTHEERALVGISQVVVRHPETGEALALLVAGVLLNQNLDFIDHINRIVYPDGSLPFGSQGTATLFLDDVRITTNVRLFQDQRAIGTRVSQVVRDTVLGEGQTWLDRAFVVNDWYVSAYQPLMDADKQRIGMLYVGFLEQPFRWVRHVMLGLMGLIFLVVTVLTTVLSWRWAHSIFRPVERMQHTLQQVALGDAQARVGAVTSTDELGELARHLDHLLHLIADKTAALQRWGAELDQRVRERTAELEASHRSLQQAQQQLVRSEKLAVMGQLAASVAHEVNNPIAIMQGNLDLIRDTLGTHATPIATELHLLDEQIERIRMIVQQLLQHAKPDEYAGYTEAIDGNDTLKASLLLLNHALSQAQVQVVLDLQATPPITINRQELQQVHLNLLMNALHAMPHGGCLRVSTRHTPATADTPEGVALSIQDSGPGLSEAVLAQLFHPFFTTRAEGHGLGLWISQMLIERYQGHISASNVSPEQGPGAVFQVWLPVSQPGSA